MIILKNNINLSTGATCFIGLCGCCCGVVFYYIRMDLQSQVACCFFYFGGRGVVVCATLYFLRVPGDQDQCKTVI